MSDKARAVIWHKANNPEAPPSNARQLAKACGAATRAYQPVCDLVKLTSEMPLQIARQGNAVLEELDLLRFYLREATLRGVIDATQAPLERAVQPAGIATPAKAQKPRRASRPPAKAKRKRKRR